MDFLFAAVSLTAQDAKRRTPPQATYLMMVTVVKYQQLRELM